MKKNHLLSINEFSKYSDRSLKAIKYYEKIGLLLPHYIDPDTGYRYYLPNQVATLEMAEFATELHVPLKNLPCYIDENGHLKSTQFLQTARNIAQEKLNKAQIALSAIALHETQLNTVKNGKKSSSRPTKPATFSLPRMSQQPQSTILEKPCSKPLKPSTKLAYQMMTISN